MKIAYFDIVGGASGDMMLGALVDAGLSVESLEFELTKLPISGYHFDIEKTHRLGVHGTHLGIKFVDTLPTPNTWADFISIIHTSSLSEFVKQQSLTVFDNLAKAEKRAHRLTIDNSDVQLAELGSLDTLIDIVGTIVGLQLLGIEKIYCSPIPMGSGIISSGHGILPASSPATLELVAMISAPIVPPRFPNTGELVTPTGAALLTTLANFDPPNFFFQRVGYGLGSRNPQNFPNALSLWIGHEQRESAKNSIVLLETNIDDMNAQIFGYVQEKLFNVGVLDVWFTSIQMKKGRPGVLLSVLVPKELENNVVAIIFSETSTLGIRTKEIDRYEAERELRLVETAFGNVHVKIKFLEGKPVSIAPEYEDCSRIARDTQIPLNEVLRDVAFQARKEIISGMIVLEKGDFDAKES